MLCKRYDVSSGWHSMLGKCTGHYILRIVHNVVTPGQNLGEGRASS